MTDEITILAFDADDEFVGDAEHLTIDSNTSDSEAINSSFSLWRLKYNNLQSVVPMIQIEIVRSYDDQFVRRIYKGTPYYSIIG